MNTNDRSSNVDDHFQKRSYLMFPSKTIRTDGIRAGIMVRVEAQIRAQMLNACP